MKIYTADFETTTNKEDLRVWAWGVCEIENFNNFIYGNSIESFIKWCKENAPLTLYFHNLKFDAEFILSYLLSHNFKYSERLRNKYFNTIIAGTGQFYKLSFSFGRDKNVTIYDSLKKLPFSVKKIAESFELPILKGEIDYTAEREKGHILTEEELAYLRNDVEIVARALKEQFDEGLTHMTIGSDSLHIFKDMIGEKRFEKMFPVLPVEIDNNIRKAYRGGYTYVNKIFQNKDIGEGQVFDVNSMYPSVMHDELLPYGIPQYFEGEYIYDDLYPLAIFHIRADLSLKKDHIPTIQCKNNFYFNATEYIENTNGMLSMYITNIDFEIIKSQYDIIDIEYCEGFKFKGVRGVFTEYIDKYMEMKKNNTGAKRQLAKLLLNNLYGKFATNPKMMKKIPFLNEDGVVCYETKNCKDKDSIYTAMGIFITSYARARIQKTAQSIYNRFCYCDTDSIHIIGKDIPNIDIDQKELGKWGLENTFKKARFLRAKTYIEVLDDDSLNVKCAGLPDKLKEKVTFDNFKYGLKIEGKLLPKRYKGGVILEEHDFTIK